MKVLLNTIYRLFVINILVMLIISNYCHSQIIIPDTVFISKIDSTIGIYSDKIYNDNIKSVVLSQPDYKLAYPVMKLYSSQKLELSFDILNVDTGELHYTIEHIDKNWGYRDAMVIEYMDGFEDNDIDDYQESYSNSTRYTHYKLNIPNDDVKFKVSGNYIVKVYAESIDNPLFTKRFVVYENKIEIQGTVKQSLNKDYGSTSHKINFNLLTKNIELNDPYSDLDVKIVPNNNYQKMHDGFKPMFVRDNELVFADNENNIFEAGNEYRTFILKDLSYQPIMIAKILFLNGSYHVILKPDFPRIYKQYESHEDLNGQFYIDRANSMTPDLDGEYVWVNFELKVETPYLSGQVFVFGGFCSFSFSKLNAMTYNSQTKTYSLNLLLKQGYYDYQYVLVDRSKNIKPNFSIIEGNHYQTQNNYPVYVYYRDLFKGVDRVVGYKVLR